MANPGVYAELVALAAADAARETAARAKPVESTPVTPVPAPLEAAVAPSEPAVVPVVAAAPVSTHVAPDGQLSWLERSVKSSPNGF